MCRGAVRAGEESKRDRADRLCAGAADAAGVPVLQLSAARVPCARARPTRLCAICLRLPVVVQACAVHAQGRAHERAPDARGLLHPQVYLGEQYVNNPTLSDVTFLVEVRPPAAHVAVCRKRCAVYAAASAGVHAQSWKRSKLVSQRAGWEVLQTTLTEPYDLQGRKFHAHRIALLASSDTFRAMFDGHYKEKEASQIPIPNIRFCVFESMMRCIYTGARAAPRVVQWLVGHRSCRGLAALRACRPLRWCSLHPCMQGRCDRCQMLS